MKRRALLALGGLALGGLALAGCAQEERPVGVVALPERSLAYAPLLLAVRRGLRQEPASRVAVTQRVDGQAVAAAVVTGEALVGAMALPDLVRAATAGAPLVAIGALTKRLDCHLVVTTARGVPVPTLPAIYLGEWRGLRVGVESGADGTEAFARLAALWGNAARVPPQEPFAPRAPQRELAAASRVEGEARWEAFETDAALAAALADQRIEAFIGRPYAAAQSVAYGAGQVTRSLATGDESQVLAALPTVLVARRDMSGEGEGALIRRLLSAVGRAGTELSGAGGGQAAAEALPERDSLRLTIAQRLMASDSTTGAYAPDARLDEEAVRRYLELSAMAGARVGLNAGALITNRFSG